MSDILNINGNVLSDNSITSIQEHIYNPYTSSYNHNDEIRIPIQQQDLYLLIANSSILVDVNIVHAALAPGGVHPAFDNFYAGFLFEEIRYEINGVEVDRCKNVPLTTLMKTYCSFTKGHISNLYTSSFYNADTAENQPNHFCHEIPLRMVLGIAEDYNKIIMNAKHELILVRSRTNTNCFFGPQESIDITVNKVQWKVPHVQVSDRSKLMLMKNIERKHSIPLTFRSWDLYEYPVLPATDKHVWSVKTTNHLNKPRYVIVGFQTNKKNILATRAAHFDNINIRDISLSLNSERYPYEQMDLNFTENRYTTAFNMYTKFQESYYNHTPKEVSSYFSYQGYGASPLFVFDCSRQNEAIKTSMIDIRLEFSARGNFAANTAAYCLIIHDNVVTYNPYNNIVNRVI